jgi:hypothetical protein
MLPTEVPKPPSKSAVDLAQAIRALPREERLWLLKQMVHDLVPEDLEVTEAGAVPSTAYAKELLAYFELLPDDERAIIEELARRDATYGSDPTPGL